MLKAIARSSTGPILLVGISEENVARLRDDKPISLRLDEFGLDGVKGQMVIAYGRTEVEIASRLRRAGLITEQTVGVNSAELDAHLALKQDESKVLIVTVGLPRSGKSTWARTQSYPIVCPDEIRTALHGRRFIAEAEPFVWAICKVMVRALFGAGHQFVILDAANVSRKRRDEWRSSEWALRFKYINTSEDDCRKRADDEEDHEIQPVITRMALEFEPLGEDEHLFV